MCSLNVLRWTTSVIAIIFLILFYSGRTLDKPVLEAVSIVALFIDGLVIVVKNRCPGCNRMLPSFPSIWTEEEFCQYCGTKIE